LDEAAVIPAVKAFIVEKFLFGEDADKVTPSTPLISGGIIDSLGVIELVTFLEQRFGITIEAKEAGRTHLDTLAAIETLVKQKRG
jgi:acyl carrier protein